MYKPSVAHQPTSLDLDRMACHNSPLLIIPRFLLVTFVG